MRGKAGAVDESQVLARVELHDGNAVSAVVTARDEVARKEREARREDGGTSLEVSSVTLRGAIDEERAAASLEHVATGLPTT